MSCRGAAAAAAALATLLLLALLPAPPPAPGLPTPDPLSASAVEDTSARDAGAEPLDLVRDHYTPGHARAHAELCAARGARTRLLVLVTSAPEHEALRASVRLTWGSVARRADFALGFVLGHPAPDLRPSLEAEDALYGDLIEGNFYDSYYNLTLKSVSMLEWFVNYCPDATCLLKTDDDMFINIGTLLRFLEAPERRRARTVWGDVRTRARPVRNASSKYFVPEEEFPGERYPRYVGGGAYLVARDATRALLAAALRARWLRMEDVLVTGVAAAAAGVARAPAPRSRQHRPLPDKCALRDLLAVHEVAVHEQFRLWSDLHDPTHECPP